jgi:membrane protein implicated in regulation of membrane protease activity
MVWWAWVVFGLGLLVVELATPGGLFALFFGVGALCVAPLAAAGAGVAFQWLVFSALSLLLLGALRTRIQARIQRSPAVPVDSLVGQEVVLLQDVPEGGEGKAELRGVPWSARAAAGVPLHKGQRCKVERVDGLTLYVTAA